MKEKQWYERLFENYAEHYDQEVFTQGTQGEVDFIVQETGNDCSVQILDIGCGTGRHAIELARRGYKVTGIDLSEAQLKRAREKTRQAGVQVEFLIRDARDFHFDTPFDMAIMICEGAFSLMESDAMNVRILKNAADALKSGGIFIFTTLSALYPLFHSVKDFINAQQQGMRIDEFTFDLMTFREQSVIEISDDGIQRRIHTNERYFTPSEIRWYLETLGFVDIDIYGAKLGAFSRNDQLTVEDYEMLVIAKRK